MSNKTHSSPLTGKLVREFHRLQPRTNLFRGFCLRQQWLQWPPHRLSSYPSIPRSYSNNNNHSLSPSPHQAPDYPNPSRLHLTCRCSGRRTSRAPKSQNLTIHPFANNHFTVKKSFSKYFQSRSKQSLCETTSHPLPSLSHLRWLLTLRSQATLSSNPRLQSQWTNALSWVTTKHFKHS
jgi:hypothetical protein